MFKFKHFKVLKRALCILETKSDLSSVFERGFRSSAYCYKKRRTREEKKAPKALHFTPKSKWKNSEVVDVWKNMTMLELAQALGKDVDHVLQAMTYINDTAHYRKPQQVIDNFTVVQEVAKKSGKRWRIVSTKSEEEDTFVDLVRRNRSEYVDVRPRPPVVTIMGHVDHGKTTLLDTLRESSIVEKEYGGITQHIGAFSVKVGEQVVTFLDTPGHAAFCSMRSRGAQCTDIVVLVVATDDGVMEQTIESIKMANEANVPIIVAANKIDKPQSDVEATKKMLCNHGIQVEDYGGDVQVVPVSALKGTNVETLIDAILIQSELMELSSDYSGPVEAVVIECSTDNYRGKLCTILVQCGTLKKGTILVAGTACCKVRAMFDESGNPVQVATPSTPVQTVGWKDLPSAGDLALEAPSEKRASDVILKRSLIKNEEKALEDLVVIEQKAKDHYELYREKLEAKRKLGRYRVRPDGPRSKLYQEDKELKLNVLIKGDVGGSVEAILDVLDSYSEDRCKLNVVHYGVGAVTKNDIVLAECFDAVIYAFNTQVLDDAKTYPQIKRHNVIYKLVDDIKSELNNKLPAVDAEDLIGEASVLQEFVINEGKAKVPVAGCRCVKGQLKKSARARVVRSGDTIHDGSVVSLRHLKNEVDTIKKDLECGIRLLDPSFNFKPGDSIIFYEIKKVPQTINWDPGF